MRRIIIIAPHPDDETLGCGGTILKHKDMGDEIYWLIITSMKEADEWDKDKIKIRKKEIKKVSSSYKFNGVFELEYPAAKLDTVPRKRIVSSIANIFKKIKPEIIYLNNRSDIHSDHGVTFESAYSCTKNFRYPFIKKILMYETLSETEFTPALQETAFTPNVFVDISDYIDRKIEIMKIYKSEMLLFPLPRSSENIKALSLYRGSRVAVKYAESFMLLKEIL